MHLYHYMRPEYVLPTIEQNSLKISTLDNLNDPYEMLPDLVDEKGAHAPIWVVQEQMREILGNTGMLCLSASVCSPAMWAHYACKHKGVVFDFEFTEEQIATLSKVVYTKQRVVIGPNADLHAPAVRNIILDKLIRTKSDAWAHEEEYRWVFPLQYLPVSQLSPGHYALRLPQELRSIVLGAECDLDAIGLLRTLIGKGYSDITVSRARLSATGLDIVVDSLCQPRPDDVSPGSTYVGRLIQGECAYDHGHFGEALSHVKQARAVSGFERGREALALTRALAPHCRIISFGGGWQRRAFDMHLYATVSFSVDGRFGISGETNGDVQLWTLDSGTPFCVLKGHTHSITSLHPSADGHYLLSGSNDATARLWDIRQCYSHTWECIRVFEGHAGSVRSVAMSADGKIVFSGGEDRVVRVWDVETGQLLGTLTGHTGTINAVSLSANAKCVWTASSDGTIRSWDSHTGQCLRVLDGHPGGVICLAVSPDGCSILSGGMDEMLRLWDIATGRAMRTFSGHSEAVNAVAFSPSIRYIASCAGSHIGGHWASNTDSSLRLWDTVSGECVHVFEGHNDGVQSMALSRDGRHLLSGSSGYSPSRLWEIDWEYEYNVHHDSMPGRPFPCSHRGACFFQRSESTERFRK